MPNFRVTMGRTVAVRKDGTPMTPTQLLRVRDVFAVRGRTERRVWEFEAADEAEVRKLLKEAGDHPNVRGFDLESITLTDGVGASCHQDSPPSDADAQQTAAKPELPNTDVHLASGDRTARND